MTKEGSFNFGTAKKMEPVVAIATATGMNWLVIYSAPETYGNSYIGSTFTTVLTLTTPGTGATTSAKGFI